MNQNSRLMLIIIVALLITNSMAQLEIAIPPALIIPNYNRIPVGQYESAEGGAAVARSTGFTATWYNPAGISVLNTAAISANYTGYELVRLRLENYNSLSNTGLEESPGLFSIVFNIPFKKFQKYKAGISLGNQISWRPTIQRHAQFTLADGQIESVSLSAQYRYSTAIPALSIAWRLTKSLGLGFSIEFPSTDLYVFQSFSDKLSARKSRIIDVTLRGNAYQLMLTLGAQWALSKKVYLGFVMRTPALNVVSFGSTFYSSSIYNNAVYSFSNQRDEKATFRQKIPLQFSTGIAWKDSAWEIETNLILYSGIKTYSMLKTSDPVVITTVSSSSDSAIDLIKFPSILYNSRFLINASIGGQLRLSSGLRLHAGFFTDLSPLDTSLLIFQKINLLGATIGVSLTGKRVIGGVGIRGEFGKSDRISIENSFSSQPLTSRINLLTFALIWAISIKLPSLPST